ncbi:MAG: enoyl-CoA hydratase/isomerase family protein, partial [Lysobacteraceae bacterium]
MRLLYSGAFLSAEEALALGYVASVVEPEALADAASEEARRFLTASPFAVRRVKELVYRGLERDLEAHLAAHGEAL